MAETSFARCRNAALLGLLLQIAAFAVALGLGISSHSIALLNVAWYILGGVPLWLASLLVFRQHELAEFEKMDLEELRRERQASGGGEGIFEGDAAGGLGFLVAASRLAWMKRWLVPTFGLINVIYLLALAWLSLRRMPPLSTGGEGWPELTNVPLAMIGAAVLLVALFLNSRFASGMGRVAEWRLLRACGAYVLGNAVAAAALIVCLGLFVYAGVAMWEHWLAYAVPVLMAVLAVETLLNFVLDIYRPRTPGTEPRAAFDSRILGLISEPGGIAQSIADAINYQFGFQVSQTWFYQLLQRAFIPLFGLGVLSLWTLSCVVLIEPNERGIVERFGRQLNADQPLTPGLHFKLPWPFESVTRYNTGQLHGIVIGYENDIEPSDDDRAAPVILWTDETHYGRKHYNFIIAPRQISSAMPASAPASGAEAGADAAAPVHMIRMNVAVQYRVPDDRLAAYSRGTVDPHRLLRNLAWEEVLRFNAGSDVDALLGESHTVAGNVLRERLAKRVSDLGLGLDIVYVGLQEVHPEKSVAESFRKVVIADQQRVTDVSRAREMETLRLSTVAGTRAKARALFRAGLRRAEAERQFAQTESAATASSGRVSPELLERIGGLRPLFASRTAAEGRLAASNSDLEDLTEETALGLGGSAAARAKVQQEMQTHAEGVQAATAALDEKLNPLKSELAAAIGADAAEALLDHAAAREALAYWNERLSEEFVGNSAAGVAPADGQVGMILAEANSRRWQQELRAVAESAGISGQYAAYIAAPEIYQARRYLEVLTEGLKTARKFFLAFDPGERKIHVRIEAQDSAESGLRESTTRMPQ